MGKFYAVLVLVLGAAYYFASHDNYDPKSIAGKRVLVTGASSGIGEQLAYHYSELGAKLVLTARRAELLEQVAKRCRQLGAKEVSVILSDMSKPEDRVKVADFTRNQLHGLDHLILNHAIMRAGPWRSIPEDMANLANDMNLNFYSFVELASRLLPTLTESQGQIGVVSSVGGKACSPLASIYCANKFAMQGFFSAWRQELIHRGSGVSVTMAVLGPIATEAGAAAMKTMNSGVDFSGIAADPKDTAQAIVRAVETRVYEMYYGRMAGFMVTLHKIIPETLEKYMALYTLSNYTFDATKTT